MSSEMTEPDSYSWELEVITKSRTQKEVLTVLLKNYFGSHDGCSSPEESLLVFQGPGISSTKHFDPSEYTDIDYLCIYKFIW